MGNGSATEFVQSYSNTVSSSVGVGELVQNFNLYTLSGMKPLLRCFSNLRTLSSVVKALKKGICRMLKHLNSSVMSDVIYKTKIQRDFSYVLHNI